MIAVVVLVALLGLDQWVCFFQDDDAIVSARSADWSYLEGTESLVWTASPAYNQVANGSYRVTYPVSYWPEEDRWFSLLDPVPPVPENVCLWGELLRGDIFAGGFETADVTAWSAIVGEAP